MNWGRIIILLEVLFFIATGFFIMRDQFQTVGVWFQFTDLHHETFAIASFALAIGILIGATRKKRHF